MARSIPIFAGYDPEERVGYHVFSHSILTRSSLPVSITPIALNQLSNYYWRERNPLQSTDFSISRFIAPYLNGSGWCIFADGVDMLCLEDIAQLWRLRDDRYAVMVVKHDHNSDETEKFLGRKQTKYPRKNWSSLMLINCDRWKDIGRMEVNTLDPVYLHRFQMFRDEEIGELPAEWNHLVGVTKPNPSAKIVHFTLGIPPIKPDYVPTEYVQEWLEEYWDMLYPKCRMEGIIAP